jgi:hypothetical protein
VPSRNWAWSCGRISTHRQRRSHTSSWGELSRRRSHRQAYACCKRDSEAISSIPSTGRLPAGGVDASPNGSYHMAGRVVPEWLKTPVSKTRVAVARFGLIDRRAQDACSMLRCVGPTRASDGTETKAHRPLENSLATAVILRLPRFSSIALRKMLRTALTVGIDASPPPVCTV